MKFTKVQITTVVLIIAWIAWEIYIKDWSKTQIGANIRVDLLIIYPIIFVMLSVSMLQFFRHRK